MKKYRFDEIDIPEESGIYFLYGEKDELLYIGQSVNLKRRLYTHFNGSSNLKHFNVTLKKFSMMFVEGEQLAIMEKRMILKYLPHLNKIPQSRNGVIKTTYEIDEHLHNELKIMAVRQKRKVSEIVEAAIRQYLTNE